MSNRLRVLIDWTLDLMIERSITQVLPNHPDLRDPTPVAGQNA